MSRSQEKYLLLLVVSLVISYLLLANGILPRSIPPVLGPTSASGQRDATVTLLALAASCLASITSFIGLIATTIMQVQRHRLEMEEKKLSIKKLLREENNTGSHPI